MKSLRTRRPPTEPSDTAGSETQGQDGTIDEGPASAGGWSTGARANTSALVRWGLWCLIVLGPLLGTIAFLTAPTSADLARPKSAPSAPATTGGQGAAGFAQLFVDEYLRAGKGDQNRLAAYYPAADSLRLEGTPNRRSSEQLAIARLRQTERGVWSVTVAARIREAKPATTAVSDDRSDAATDAEAAAASAVRYFQVPVATAPAARGASGFVALAMPAEVGAPPRIEAPELVYGPMRPALPSDPRTEAVTEFLTAYLVGGGDLDRYLAPGTDLTPIVPAPYTGLAVDQLAIEGEQGAEPVTAVPGDGTTLRVLVTLRATGHDEVRVPLAYALTLTARAGRWEIAAVDGAPAPAPPAPAPSTTAS
ncbi:conjugal transfer protein [Streptomyces niveus]|uniref:conjugal transfer protein n=1 Tax=Streptomyces niveus TaxID=193462 RepID=UPI003638170B